MNIGPLTSGYGLIKSAVGFSSWRSVVVVEATVVCGTGKNRDESGQIRIKIFRPRFPERFESLFLVRKCDECTAFFPLK